LADNLSDGQGNLFPFKFSKKKKEERKKETKKEIKEVAGRAPLRYRPVLTNDRKRKFLCRDKSLN
jgi:hypothetical protein